MHPNLTTFIEKFEREAMQHGLYRNTLGKSELIFLREVWGPAFQYNYEGLKAEYPLKDFKGGQRFADFVYVKNDVRLLVEIDGFTTHARNISPGEFDDHLTRQNDIVLSGWLVMRFSANQVERHPQICQRQLKQAIGHWWSITQNNLSANDVDLWALRKQFIVQMAMRRSGTIKPGEVAKEFKISNRTASTWLKRFSSEGVFTYPNHNKRVMNYTLAHYVE